VGNYDADPLRHSGDWDEVVPYVEDIQQFLANALGEAARGGPIGINFSENDVKADGLTHGMRLLLDRYLSGTEGATALISAEDLVMPLRGVKTQEELSLIRGAIAEGDRIFAEIAEMIPGAASEREVYLAVHEIMAQRGLGFAWDKAGNPIVNSGPDSMIGHGIPSSAIKPAPGHIFHVDLGVTSHGYSSDIQRCWYVAAETGEAVPQDVVQAAAAVNRAISSGAALLKPGVLGWQVDDAARTSITSDGYPEYKHALGHQVGKVAHDGGAILGPRWARYGRTPEIPIREGEVYTLELGVTLPGRGYLGLEEMVVVTADGCKFLSQRQFEIPSIPRV
jgi:Xaa-Pro aminopeptidase